MKIAIVGSRNYPNVKQVQLFVKSLPKGTEVVSGDARGVDAIVKQSATANQLKTTIFKANWIRFTKSAGIRRNIEIIQYADYVAAFWWAESAGTTSSILLSLKYKKPVRVFTPSGEMTMEEIRTALTRIRESKS